MSLIVWLTQSFLLSVATFFLLGEEFVLDLQGDLPCLKAIPAASQNKQYSSESCDSKFKCFRMNKSGNWQLPFGVLSVFQISSFIVVYGLKARRKSPSHLPFVFCVTCCALTTTLLLTKLAAQLSPQHSAHGTTASGGYGIKLFTFARNALVTAFVAAFQWISPIFVYSCHSESSSKEGSTLLKRESRDGLYYCSTELNSQALERGGATISHAIVFLIVAYFISSSYTLYLLLAHDGCDKQILKPVNNNTQPYDTSGVRGCDNLEVGDVGEGNRMDARSQKCTPYNGLVNKKEMIVACMEQESDEESFVFGWRL